MKKAKGVKLSKYFGSQRFVWEVLCIECNERECDYLHELCFECKEMMVLSGINNVNGGY
jgi:hypothetical protein